MAAGPWVLMNDFKLNVYNKLIDLDSDVFKVAIATSASNLAATMTPATYASVTNELATAGGYTAGGATAASPTLTGGGAIATITWDTADVAWTGTGAGFTGRFAYIYDDTAASKNVCAFCLLDSTPADVTVPAGVTATLSIANVFSAT